MEERNASFFLKLHPDDRGSFDAGGSHVHELPQGIDIYELLAATDALISDYSSIIFDFMMVERPILHFLPDLDEYRSSSRSLVFDPVEIAVGPVCLDADKLKDSLEEVLDGGPPSPDVLPLWAGTRRRMNRYTDGDSNQRVLAAIRRAFPEVDPYVGEVRGSTVGA